MAKARVTFGRFEVQSQEFAEMAVLVDGRGVGTITRCSADEFVTASSRARQWKVYSYEVMLDLHDDVELDLQYDRTFKVTRTTDARQALADAKDYCREQVARRFA